MKNFLITHYYRFINLPFMQKTIHFLTDWSTYKKTVRLALLYVLLFYLPFTILFLFFREPVFFQLDYLYQFSTIIFDFRNRLMDLNFSTWDFKNGLGYDYFANFYYIPLDFSLLPYFIFPFLTFSQQMWLSFLLKIFVGTFAFSYLLKLYKMSNKTILFMSVLYGTSDLFFAQNVFPSFTGLIYYIPLLLIAIELIFQKKNYLFFSLAIFQIFLFNSYWSFSLTIFMTLALFIRACLHFFTYDNFKHFKDTIKTFIHMLLFFIKCILYYALGVGLAAFFVFPILNIIVNEPRMTQDLALNLKNLLAFDQMVYYKTFLKMLIPNLFMYSGYFYDNSKSYWLPTNQIIIYSSILATFTIFQFLFTSNKKVKRLLTPNQFKTFITLKIITLLSIPFMLVPLTADIFSLNTSSYLRYFIFFGVLLMVNLAFILEYQLFNKTLFVFFISIAILYLNYSIYFNRTKDIHKTIFFDTDHTVTFTMIIIYIVIFAYVVLFIKKTKFSIVLFIERMTLIWLIASICIAPYYSLGVKHPDEYGKAVNELMKNTDFNETYYTMFDNLYYNDYSDYEVMADMSYLFDFKVYNNFNIFHSLISPTFTYFRDTTNHNRYYRALDVPYLYYLYMDPTLFVQSNSTTSGIHNQFYPYDSTLIGKKAIPSLDSEVTIYKNEPQLSIGSGFTNYYSLKKYFDYDFLWLDSYYTDNEQIIKMLENNGFKEERVITGFFLHSYYVSSNKIEADYKLPNNPNLKLYAYDLPIDSSNKVVMAQDYDPTEIKALYSIDNNDNINRCFNRFCFVPESGLKKLVIGVSKDNSGFYASSVDFYTLNNQMLQDKLSQVKKYSTYDVKINGNTITSKIDNDKPIIMQYKIGYAKGWEVLVDGKEVNTFASQGGMLSFLLNDTGTHQITMNYHTPGLIEPMYIKGIPLKGLPTTLISIGIFTILYINKRGKK